MIRDMWDAYYGPGREDYRDDNTLLERKQVVRWRFYGDTDKATEYVQLAQKARARTFNEFRAGTHLGMGVFRETHPVPVKVAVYSQDGKLVDMTEDVVEDALHIEIKFHPMMDEVIVWHQPPIERRKLLRGGEGECRGEDYIWIGMRMEGSMDAKASMHVWEPWDKEDGNFVGPSDKDDGGSDLMQYSEYVGQDDSRLKTDQYVCYTGQNRRFCWQRCLSRKGGDDYVPGFSPESREYIFQNLQFDTHTTTDPYEDLWGPESRPYRLWHGGAPGINWNGGTVYMSRYGAYFCGPGRAHDPEDSNQLYFESFHCDPKDPYKEFDFMHKYPDEGMGWSYKENNVGPGLYGEYTAVKWRCEGKVLPGKYIVKVSTQRIRCEDTAGVNVELRVKLGRRPLQMDGLAQPKCLQLNHSHKLSTPGGSYLYRDYMPFGFNPFQAEGWRELTAYEDAYYPENPEFGPAVHSENGWWQGYLAIDAQNRFIEIFDSTSPTLLMSLGFDLGATGPPEDPDCCVNSIGFPVDGINPFPAPNSSDCPIYIPAYLYHEWYIYFYATVVSTNADGTICLIQISSQSSYGCDCEPYGYGSVFQADGYNRGQDTEYIDSGRTVFEKPPNGTDYAPGDSVIVVGLVEHSSKKIVRHVDDPWFAANPDKWVREEWRADKVCPEGGTHQSILRDMGLCDQYEC
jgi:hypothetical protein